MHKKRMLMSLMLALSSGAVACGGADDSSVEDSTESLKWGYAADGGSLRGDRGDSDDDVDEDSEEETSDGGKRGGKLHVRGDGGCSFGARGEGRGSFGGGGHGKGDHDEDSDESDDTDDKPRGDGGSRRGPGWIDAGSRR
jgi:hypothetical protein